MPNRLQRDINALIRHPRRRGRLGAADDKGALPSKVSGALGAPSEGQADPELTFTAHLLDGRGSTVFVRPGRIRRFDMSAHLIDDLYDFGDGATLLETMKYRDGNFYYVERHATSGTRIKENNGQLVGYDSNFGNRIAVSDEYLFIPHGTILDLRVRQYTFGGALVQTIDPQLVDSGEGIAALAASATKFYILTSDLDASHPPKLTGHNLGFATSPAVATLMTDAALAWSLAVAGDRMYAYGREGAGTQNYLFVYDLATDTEIARLIDPLEPDMGDISSIAATENYVAYLEGYGLTVADLYLHVWRRNVTRDQFDNVINESWEKLPIIPYNMKGDIYSVQDGLVLLDSA
ncbi:hypothetical protein HCH_02909 [Hahella chejuensis KCTC 2396]|uniref:Uncharacterized protein n=1 Tax=Hahella chejuensis (strain KCTC 2396) TaxID=349521 RepID=Q2SI41_HAHCH|nr:hypothetical protein [Hahella chejuensis]ABC29683.1 hypothetical protein HCH_02909 [Hahella chejuensis KCTC 2396]